MQTEHTQRATNRKIEWRRVAPCYNDFEPDLKNQQEDDWIMNVDGRDIASLHYQSNHWWRVDFLIRQRMWWPRGKGWLSDDGLKHEMELAVEELLREGPPRHYYTGLDV